MDIEKGSKVVKFKKISKIYHVVEIPMFISQRGLWHLTKQSCFTELKNIY